MTSGASGKPPITSLCPNCDTRFAQRHPMQVYCGDPCRSQADVVRYMRSVRCNYGDGPPELVRYQVQIQLVWMMAGGYPRGRKIPGDIRSAVIERDAGLCVECGAPGEEVDHINGDANTPENLQLLCIDCHHRITNTRIAPLPYDPVHSSARLAETHERAEAAQPLLPCDAADWEARWRTWLRDHREPRREASEPTAPPWPTLTVPPGVTPAGVRQWGRDNGWEVGVRGRLNHALLKAYLAAQSAPS